MEGGDQDEARLLDFVDSGHFDLDLPLPPPEEISWLPSLAGPLPPPLSPAPPLQPSESLWRESPSLLGLMRTITKAVKWALALHRLASLQQIHHRYHHLQHY